MVNGAVGIFTQKMAEPVNPVAGSDIIRIHTVTDIRHIGNMTAHNNDGVGQIFPDQTAHFPHFADIWHNRADSDNVILNFAYFLDKPVPGGKIQ